MKNQNLEAELLAEFGATTFSTQNPLWQSLGWSGGHVDERDWKAEDFLSAERTSGMQHWANPIQLDQGREGSCTGMGTTGVINAAPEVHEFGNEWAYALYKLAQTKDPWPGEAYEGTSVRAAGLAAVELGFFQAGFAMTQSVETLALWVLNHGPVTIGVDWHVNMDRVDSEGYIYPTGDIRGGHCVAVDGVLWGVEDQEDRARIRNSWGSPWGMHGRCRIKAKDLQTLFNDGGVAMMPTEQRAA